MVEFMSRAAVRGRTHGAHAPFAVCALLDENAVVDDDWIEVVSWRPPAEADDAFAQWLADAGVDRGSLDVGDIRVDLGRTSGGDMSRYWIRRAAIEK